VKTKFFALSGEKDRTRWEPKTESDVTSEDRIGKKRIAPPESVEEEG